MYFLLFLSGVFSAEKNLKRYKGKHFLMFEKQIGQKMKKNGLFGKKKRIF